MASASVSSVSGITAVLNLDDGEFKALTVLKFRYEEELGQPFAIEIELQSTSGVLTELTKLSPNRVVGRTLVVTISGGNAPIRHFHAIMETFVAVDNGGAFNRYRGTAVPWYSLLKLAENSQIYSDTNVEKLLKKVHADFRFSASTFVLNITQAKPVSHWTTRTQYCETYFQFLQRSLQQEGWHYYWTHTSQQHAMNTADGSEPPDSFTGANGHNYSRIPYKPLIGGNATTECIYEWSPEAAVQPLKFQLSDFNYAASADKLVQEFKSDYADGGGGFSTDDIFKQLLVSRHPGQFSKVGRDTPAEQYAKRLMQQFTCRQAFVRGKAVCVGLAAGHLFNPSWETSAPSPYVPEKSNAITGYLTTKIILHIDWPHESNPSKPRKPLAIDCEFTAIPWDGTKSRYRSTYDATEPQIFGVQSAVVCAAAAKPHNTTAESSGNSHSSETPPIYCDYGKDDKVEKSGPYGRVKVKFPWCRGENERTDWIRLTHLMAGNGWGEFHLPRPGDEVLVAFEHGDPDRPVIVGCLYNDRHAMPFDLSPPGGDALKKLFAIKDPGGNLFIMDPGLETNPKHPSKDAVTGEYKMQTISLYSYAKKESASVQIGFNAKKSPGVPEH